MLVVGVSCWWFALLLCNFCVNCCFVGALYLLGCWVDFDLFGFVFMCCVWIFFLVCLLVYWCLINSGLNYLA